MILDGVFPTEWENDTLHGVSRDALFNQFGLVAYNLLMKISDIAYPTGWENDTDKGATRNALFHALASVPVVDTFGFRYMAMSVFDYSLNHLIIENTNDLAYFYGTLDCPYTRDDWKIEIRYHNTDTSKAGSGQMRLGAYGIDEAPSTINKLSMVNFDLSNVDASKSYSTISDAFSLNKRDVVNMRWNKDANEGGAEFLLIESVRLIF